MSSVSTLRVGSGTLAVCWLAVIHGGMGCSSDHAAKATSEGEKRVPVTPHETPPSHTADSDPTSPAVTNRPVRSVPSDSPGCHTCFVNEAPTGNCMVDLLRNNAEHLAVAIALSSDDETALLNDDFETRALPLAEFVLSTIAERPHYRNAAGVQRVLAAPERFGSDLEPLVVRQRPSYVEGGVIALGISAIVGSGTAERLSCCWGEGCGATYSCQRNGERRSVRAVCEKTAAQ